MIRRKGSPALHQLTMSTRHGRSDSLNASPTAASRPGEPQGLVCLNDEIQVRIGPRPPLGAGPKGPNGVFGKLIVQDGTHERPPFGTDVESGRGQARAHARTNFRPKGTTAS